MTERWSRVLRRVALHVLRALLLAVIFLLIHLQHRQLVSQRQGQAVESPPLDEVRVQFPKAHTLRLRTQGRGGHEVLDESGELLGRVLQTSPQGDQRIGFSGPTNTLVAMDPEERIVGLSVLSSGDTAEHVRQVIEDQRFFAAFEGRRVEELGDLRVDAVSGATLTSRAIQESILDRLGGPSVSLRFPDPLAVEDVRTLFAEATSVEPDPKHGSLWLVRDRDRQLLGSVLRTSPAADHVVGFQGPTDTRIGVGRDGNVVGIAVGPSYDNEPYVSYVREDRYFLSLFQASDLQQLATLDLEQAEVEGVSGATMTSMAVAQGLVLAARSQVAAEQSERARRERHSWFGQAWWEGAWWEGAWWGSWRLRDVGTAGMIALGMLVGMTRLRGSRYVRIGFQLLLIGYLGLVNGDLLSQAMLVGWARNGVPWRTAGGLVLLTGAALLIPLTTRRNLYCSHLCPHGAAQQLLMNRLPWKIRLPARLAGALRLLPALLLAWCVIVGVTALPFSLVDIEPFDAWVFRVAGWSTITVAVVGLVASMFVPMAYCRYGCPTGAMLGYLRFSSHSDRWTGRDWLALGLVLLAALLRVAA